MLQKISAAFSLLGILAITIFSAGNVYAQVSGANLSGTITDPSGAAIAGAKVTITNKATGVTRDATADAAGFYSAPNLLPGPYEVTAAASGFSTAKQSDLTLTVGAQQVLNLGLKIGEASQTVQVTEAASLVQTSSSTLSAEVESATVRELPLNGRDWASLATLSPGVNAIETQMPFDAGAVRGNRGFGAQLTISGGRPTQNNYRLDGNSINDYGNGAPGSVIGGNLGVDAIQEFSVLTGNYSAEYGRTSGGVVNAISKSGTNAFHGDIYEFLRNDKLDAEDYFSNANGAKKASLRRNQFGGAAGGPIRKDRTFIFGDYEGIRQNKGIAGVSYVVPSDAARLGNLANGTHVKVDPAITKYLALYPHANGPINGDKGAFATSGTQIVKENYYTFRVDHKISDKDSLFGTYMYDKTPFSQPNNFDNVNVIDQTLRYIAAVEESHIFSPTLVNSARLGFNRNAVINYKIVSAINPASADLSFGAFPNKDNPSTRIGGGFTTLDAGLLGGYSLHNWNSYQFYDDAFLTRGTHSLKFGFALENMRYNFFQNYNPEGIWRFSSLTNFLTNQPTSLEGGLPDRLNPRALRQTLYGGYIQDDWRVLPHLTLNIGLRYEMTTLISEAQGKITNLANLTDPLPYCGTSDPSLTLVFGKPGCTGVRPYYSNPTKLDFEPRFGFAWDPRGDGKTAVRGGFAIFDVLPLPGYFFSQQSIQTPFLEVGIVSGLTPANGIGVLAGQPNSAFSKMGPGSLTGGYLEQNPARSYVEQWNINVQRQITPSLTATVGYIGSHGVHMMMRGDDGNDVLPTETAAGFLWPFNPTKKDLRLNPNFGGIRFMTYGTDATYAALTVNVQKRMSHGFQFGAAYTYSRSEDSSSATIAGDAFSNSITSWFWFAPQISRGPSDYNVPHSVAINAIWQVPGPRTGFAHAVLGGWETGGILKMNNGVPTTPLIAGDPMQVQNNGSDTFGIPNLAAGCDPINHNYKSGALAPDGKTFIPMSYINSKCFTLPIATAAIQSQCVPFIGTGTLANPQFPGTCSNLLGNAGRNSIIGPPMVNFDFSLYKNFAVKKISETFSVQFRAEFFNVLNHANFAPPLAFQGSKQAQLLNENGTFSNAGGLDTLVTQPRDIQFALKVIW
jgi:carboxypeptidase family protein/TonB-dependent receptor-like protein